ncbi:hypothetical protein [Pararhizobium sp. IMCC21322]|uniref:hypothetical protein n=1 Tax=Pararhizobium sp. IMCC21322 TaxID=3067903 RepID=UPI0027420485|nr:hypothetical protein [Pararhizobium sp. IMCC21322]
MKILLMLLLLLGVAMLAFMNLGPEKLWNRLHQIEPLELSTWPGRETPNWALACPDTPDGSSFCKGAERTHTSATVKASTTDLLDWFVTYVAGDGKSAASVVTRDDERKKARFQILSSGLKFPDIVDLEIIDLGNGTASAAILSQSLLGIEDFGVNSERVDAWLKAYSAEFPSK